MLQTPTALWAFTLLMVLGLLHGLAGFLRAHADGSAVSLRPQGHEALNQFQCWPQLFMRLPNQGSSSALALGSFQCIFYSVHLISRWHADSPSHPANARDCVTSH
jgi:hypothetical protein